MTTRATSHVGLAIMLAITLAGASPARAETPKQKDIRRLLVLTGSTQLFTQMMGQLKKQVQAVRSGVPEKFWAEFMKKVRADDLIALIVPIYDKHLNHAEVKDLIAFYETPTGRKLVRVLPLISQETMGAGQKWAIKIAEAVDKELKRQGY